MDEKIKKAVLLAIKETCVENDVCSECPFYNYCIVEPYTWDV